MNIFSKWRSFNFKVATVLFTASVYLVLTWLPAGQIIGGGDVGIPTLFPQKQLGEVASAWWESHATGITSPITYTAVPFYFILSVFEKIGIGEDFTQKGLFFLILFGSSISIYFLSLILFYNKWISFVSALFYIFNLTSLSVWQRGVHNAMLMLLLAPLSLLILVWGIQNKKLFSIVLINAVSFLLSYVFGALGYIFALWFLWTLFIFIALWDRWSDKPARKFILLYSLILVVSWIGTNAWWIVHLLSSSNYILGQFTPEELKARGSDVLVGLKPYHQPQYILRGLSAFYHYGVKDWGDSYFNPFLVLLSWIPTIIIFSTTLIKTNYKLASWKFLIILTVIILALSKGVNPPLGLLNTLPYDLFPFLAPLRNPYEKIGILLAIPFSLLFAQGLNQIINFFRSKNLYYLRFLTILCAIFSLVILVWPLWLGKLFVSEGRKYTVSIPSYYKEADDWLKSKVLAEDTRMLHLPLSWGESVDYNWGYTGIEPSQYFFNGSSIGYQIGVPSVDLRIRDLLISVHNQDTVNIQKKFASLNIGWVVIHNEVVHRNRILESPERINQWLATKPYFLEHTADFGPLSIWRVRDQYRLGHFYSANKLINLSSIKPQPFLNIWNKINAANDSFLTEIQDEHKDLLSKYLSENTILPKNSIVYSPLETVSEDIGFRDLARVSYLPDSLIYPLVISKENILAFLTQDDPVVNCFTLSGKRLKEAALLSRQNKSRQTNRSLNDYGKQLEKCSQINDNTVLAYMSGNLKDGSRLRELTLGQLIKQRSVLDVEFRHASVAKEGGTAKIKLIEYLGHLGLVSKYDPVKLDSNKQRIIFNYSVPKDGNYNIKLEKPDQDLMKNPPKIVQIDGQSVDLTATEVNATDIRYSAYKFSEGFHEVHIETEFNKNLLDLQIQAKKSAPDLGFTIEIDPKTERPIFAGKVLSGLIGLTFNLPNIAVEQSYKLHFDTFLSQGIAPFVTITHDSDPLDMKGNQIPAVNGQIKILSNSYSPDWENIEMNYSPVLNSTAATLSLILAPWNNSSTEVKFKNIVFEKVFKNDLVLEEANVSARNIFTAEIVWKKISPTLYELTLDNQKPPFIMTFSETFHPLWKALDSSGNAIEMPHFSINGFANAWLAEKVLPQKVYIKFILQDFEGKGILISIVSAFLLISIVAYFNYKGRSNA